MNDFCFESRFAIHDAMLGRIDGFAFTSSRVGADLLSAEAIDCEYSVYIKSVPIINHRNCN
jgi:hypothetical protein